MPALLAAPALAGTLLLAVVVLLAGTTQVQAESGPHLGYGFNVAAVDVALVEEIGFDWIKVFQPPTRRRPLHVLVRFDASVADLGNVQAFGEHLGQIAASQGAYIEAYEIGNEVNLGAAYGWGTAPVAADYVTLLCEAYRQIKAADPASVVVSAGLAPTGRISGNWNGHAGHDGSNQDEREYLKEFLAAGGAGCADVIGYHPYGFSADYDVAADAGAADPARSCVNGFCFRGVEKIHEILVEAGLGEKPVWATEFGWIVTPPAYCLDDPSFSGRLWQLVSEEKQASNLVGAFQYAEEHWPWMGAMFIFNLNFNDPGWYPECDQIRYYAVKGRPAAEALKTELAKETVPAVLDVAPTQLSLKVPVGTQPFAFTRTLVVRNEGWEALVYTATAGGNDFLAGVGPGQGMLLPLAQGSLQVRIESAARPAGIYTATVLIEGAPGTVDAPATVPVSLFLAEEFHVVHLPLLRR